MSVYQENEVAPGGVSIHNTLNNPDGSLPFGLFNPLLEGKLTWICNKSQDGNIVGVFNMDLPEESERVVQEYKDMAEAQYARDELINNGWQPLVPPKIQFTMGGDRPLNRKERRQLSKFVKQMANQKEDD